MSEKTIPPQAPRMTAPHGTFNFWIDPASELDAFAPGIFRRWGDFRFGEETCVVCSDGPMLNATLAMGTEKQRRLFRIPFVVSLVRRHLVTIGWSKGRMKVILDAKVIAEVPVTFVLWFAFVSGVVLARWSDPPKVKRIGETPKVHWEVFSSGVSQFTRRPAQTV